jgi:hypothetical protein
MLSSFFLKGVKNNYEFVINSKTGQVSIYLEGYKDLIGWFNFTDMVLNGKFRPDIFFKKYHKNIF